MLFARIAGALRRTGSNIARSIGAALLTSASLAAAFTILGGFLLTAWKMEGLASTWEAEAPVLVYLKQGLAPQRRKQLARRLRAMSQVRTVSFVSSKKAMTSLKRSLGRQGRLLRGLGHDLLPSSLDVRLKRRYRSRDALRAFARQVGLLSGVKGVDYAGEWIEPLWRALTVYRAVMLTVGLLLLFATVMISAGTITLAMARQREEIDIMRLVGATDGFIRAPYLLEAALQGLLGAAAAVGLLYGIFLLVRHELGSTLTFVGVDAGSFLPLRWLILFVLGAVATSAAGSYLASRRFLR